MEREKDRVLLFASNLASCIGMNKYAPRSEAFHKLWLHMRPNTVLPEEEAVLGMNTQEAATKVASAGTREAVEEVRQSVAARVDEKVSEAWTSAPVSAALAAEARKAITEEAVAQLETRVTSDATLTPEAKAEVMGRVKRQRRMIAEAKEVVSAAQCSLGTVKEADSRAQYEVQHGETVAHDNKFHKRWLGRTRSGRMWGLGGRVDGVDSEGRVVEIKNRMRCFFRTVPEYEAVQLQAYMVLLDVEEGVLLQQYQGAQRSTIVTRDREEWEGTIKPAMQTFVDLMDAFLDTPDWVAAWVAAGGDKAKREALLVEWERALVPV